MSKKVSILGCGWLGKALATNLIQQGNEVRGSYRSDERKTQLDELNIPSVQIDLNEDYNSKLNDFFKAQVIIMATPPSKIQLDKLDAFIQAIPTDSIEQFILISSTGIYKDCNQKVQENTGEIKTEGSLYEIESIIKRKFLKKSIILRPGGLIGPGRNPVNFMYSERITLNPRSKVNMVHQRDVVDIITKIIDQKIQNRTYNVVMDDHPTKEEFYSAVAHLNGKQPPRFNGSPKRHVFKIVDNEKIKKELNFRFQDIFDVVRSF